MSKDWSMPRVVPMGIYASVEGADTPVTVSSYQDAVTYERVYQAFCQVKGRVVNFRASLSDLEKDSPWLLTQEATTIRTMMVQFLRKGLQEKIYIAEMQDKHDIDDELIKSLLD